jgi:hypothetical protein
VVCDGRRSIEEASSSSALLSVVSVSAIDNLHIDTWDDPGKINNLLRQGCLAKG